MSRSDWDRYAIDGLHHPSQRREPMAFEDDQRGPRLFHGLVALVTLTAVVCALTAAVFGALTLVRFGLWGMS